MSEWIDSVVGRLCVEKGWMSQDQLAAYLQECASKPDAGGLSDLLVTRGHLKPDDARKLRQEVSSVLSRGEDSSQVRREDERLAEILLKKNRLSKERLEQAFSAQLTEAKSGNPAPRLGEILLGMNAVPVSALLEAAREQPPKTLLLCAACRVRYSVSGYDPSRKYGCRKCNAPLSRSDEAPTVKSSASLRVTRQDPVEEDPPEVQEAAANAKNNLGKYVVVKELGRGGMGIVHKAWDRRLKRWVALKVLTAPGTSEDLERFRREAQLAAALRHPNIVGIYEVGEAAGHPYIALEYIEGATLAGQKLPARRAAEVVAEAAKAVEYAHAKGIIHRDLKPQNVMLDRDGKAWVMDFGLAKNVRGESQLTMSGTVVGTPSYMPPEQASGHIHQLDRRADVYSLGAILYELLTGRPPFKGPTPLKTLELVVHEDVKPPSQSNAAVTPDLETIVLKCLEKDKHRRYPGARFLVEDLERWLRGEGIAARRTSMAAKLRRRFSKNKAAAVAVLAVVLAVAAVVAIGAATRRSADLELRRTLAEADAAFARGEWEKAEVLYQKAGDARRAEECRNRRDEGELAMKRKSEGDRKARSNAQPHYDQARRLYEEADKDLMRTGADLGRLRGMLKSSVDLFTKAIELCPSYEEAWLGRGLAHVLLYRPDEADRDFTKAIELQPNSFAAFLARGRLRLARYMELTETDYRPEHQPPEFLAWRDRAIEDFRRAQQLGSLGDEIEFVKASLAHAEDRLDEAISILTGLIGAGIKKEHHYKLRGDSFRRKAILAGPPTGVELKRKAFEDYTEALRVCPNFYLARRYRGALYFEFGQLPESEFEFREGLRINPEDSNAHTDMAMYLERLRRYDEAGTHVEKALALNPRNYRAWLVRAALRLNREEFKAAQADFEEALKIHPKYFSTRHGYALCLYKLGDEKRSLEILGELIRDFPKWTTSYTTRGQIHRTARRWKEALADFRKAVEIDERLGATLRAFIEECERQLGDG